MLDRCPDCHRIISGPYCACVIDHGENPDEWDDEPTRERDNWEERHQGNRVSVTLGGMYPDHIPWECRKLYMESIGKEQ
jgi:hypothetical protein